MFGAGDGISTHDNLVGKLIRYLHGRPGCDTIGHESLCPSCLMASPCFTRIQQDKGETVTFLCGTETETVSGVAGWFESSFSRSASASAVRKLQGYLAGQANKGRSAIRPNARFERRLACHSITAGRFLQRPAHHFARVLWIR